MAQRKLTPQQALRQAETLVRAGRLDEADRLLARLVQVLPAPEPAVRAMIAALKARKAPPATGAGSVADSPHIAALSALTRARNLKAADRLAKAFVAAAPDDPNALNAAGAIAFEQGDFARAARLFRRSNELRPGGRAIYNLGRALAEQFDFEGAIAAYREALAARPGEPLVMTALGTALADLHRFDEAEDLFRQVLAAHPGYSRALNGLGLVAAGRQQPEEAVRLFRAAIAADPNLPSAHVNLAKHIDDAAERIELMRTAIRLAPDRAEPRIMLARWLSEDCDWDGMDEALAPIRAELEAPAPRLDIDPLVFMALRDDQGAQSAVATAVATRRGATVVPRSFARPAGRLKVGYLAGTFSLHPVTTLSLPVFRNHDRARVESHILSTGKKKDEHTEAVIAASDHFHDLHGLDFEALAARVQALDLDILVDLQGHTGGKVDGLFERAPAPVVVNWLAYAGTYGAPTHHYLIADRTVVPERNFRHFSEAVVWMPETFMAFDDAMALGAAPSRADCRLPEDGIVFASFAAGYKIGRAEFGIWMQLLREMPGSALWLGRLPQNAVRNLRRAAIAAGVEPERLVYARRVEAHGDHLARLRLADLALDTFTYNAHSTALDYLYAGLPMVAMTGNAFPARVSTSQLRAAGLGELVTRTPQDYARLALELARDPGRLAELRARLDAARGRAPLFDSARFTRDLEAAFGEMHRRRLSGEGPGHFRVAELSGASAPG